MVEILNRRIVQARCEELELNRRAAEETTEAVRSRVRVAEVPASCHPSSVILIRPHKADLLEARQSLAMSEKVKR